jgi:hypothetical protein
MCDFRDFHCNPKNEDLTEDEDTPPDIEYMSLAEFSQPWITAHEN